MISDYKYTDTDVRANPYLVDLATEYLQTYAGEFDFLVGTQQLVKEGVPLTVGLVRGVLNCMRATPTGVDLLSKRPLAHVPPVEKRVRNQPKLEVVRRTPVSLKVNWKYSYILSTWATASVAHLLRPGKPDKHGRVRYSTLEWHDGKIGTIRLHAWCGKSWFQHAHMREVGRTLGARLSNSIEDRHICQACVRNLEEHS